MSVALHNAQQKKHTDFPRRDSVYNWLVDLYTKKGRKWEKSDDFVFGTPIYVMWDFVSMMIFVTILFKISLFVFNKYGMFYGVSSLAVGMVIRVNALIRAQQTTNRLLKEIKG